MMDEQMNVVILRGTVSEEPLERTLASGVTVTNWAVKTDDSGVVQTVPVQWEDANRKVQAMGAGDEVVVLGVVRRRFFQTGGATIARTEVLGRGVAKSTQRVAVQKLFESARLAIA